MVWQPPWFLSQAREIALTVHDGSQVVLACSCNFSIKSMQRQRPVFLLGCSIYLRVLTTFLIYVQVWVEMNR